MEYQVISADSHINEPPGTFVDRVPAKLRRARTVEGEHRSLLGHALGESLDYAPARLVEAHAELGQLDEARHQRHVAKRGDESHWRTLLGPDRGRREGAGEEGQEGDERAEAGHARRLLSYR